MPVTRRTKIWPEIIGLSLAIGSLVLNHISERRYFASTHEVMFFPVMSFGLLVGGLALLLGGAIRRTPTKLILFCFAISIGTSTCYAVLYAGIISVQTGADRFGECAGLDQAAANSGVIPDSRVHPGSPAVGCAVERRGLFLSYYNEIDIYGVTDSSSQAKVLASLAVHRDSLHTKPLMVVFYEQENWTVTTSRNGTRIGKRGPEKIVRVVPIG